MDRYKIIVNPVSGRGAGELAIPAIEQALKGYGLDYDLVRTERPWHAAELAEEAAASGYTVVVAVAGHGAIRTGQARRITITALEGALPAHADGETLCTGGQRLEMEVLPARLAIICAEEGARQ